MYLTRTQRGRREGEKQLLEEESETKKEQWAVLACSSVCGLHVGGGRAGESGGTRKEKSKQGVNQYVWCVRTHTYI